MSKLVLKLFMFLFLLVAVTTATNAYVSDQLARQNTELAMKQFDDVPATAGGINVGGLWISVNVVYILIALCFGLLGFVLFAKGFVANFKQRRK